jgi:hypothetical protein
MRAHAATYIGFTIQGHCLSTRLRALDEGDDGDETVVVVCDVCDVDLGDVLRHTNWSTQSSKTSELSSDASKYIEYEAFVTRRVATSARVYGVDTPFVICSISYIMMTV